MEEHSMIHEALQRTIDTILLSRIPELKNTKDHLSLLLLAPTVDSVREGLRDQWRRSGNTTYRVDVFLEHMASTPSPQLLERWEITHQRESDMRVDDINAQLMRSYKRITVMLRTLHSFCRIVPAYQIYHRARSPNAGMKLHYSISVQHNLGSWENVTQMNNQNFTFENRRTSKFVLPEIITPHGELNVGVEYYTPHKSTSLEGTREVPQKTPVKMERPPEQVRQSGLGALLQNDEQTNSNMNPSPKATVSPSGSFSRPPSGKTSKGPIALGNASRPMSIPSSTGTRARSRSDHIYSKSEGYRDHGVHSFQWPNNDRVDREENSFSGAPFLFVDSSSLNSDSSLNTPVRYSPPLGNMTQPHSLLSSSPQTVLDQRPYTAASMINTSSTPLHSEDFNSLPESPFTRSQLDNPAWSGQLGHDALPNETSSSIFSSMHGLSLGAGPASFGGVASNPSQLPPPQIEDDMSFLDLPFACNDVDEEAMPPSEYGDKSKSLQVSSFVHLIESAPNLSIFSLESAEGRDQPGQSIEDELREFQLFGEALKL